MTASEILRDEVALSLIASLSARDKSILRQRIGSAFYVLRATQSTLAQYVKGEVADEIVQSRLQQDVDKKIDAVFAACVQFGITMVCIDDPSYPPLLRTIYDPPSLLYLRGTLRTSDQFALAVVGTRRPTNYGCRVTAQLTAALARTGMTIVSGLARGIDSIAHRAAMEAGGRTIAVLGGGHGSIYPPEHTVLAEEIAQCGAVLSEFPPHQSPAPWRFPQRNRIVSGLSLGVLVTEAPLVSGTMITARLAGEQGRGIFAVPHAIDSPASRGCHQLLRDGAALTETIDDILGELGAMAQLAKAAVDRS